MTHGTEKPTSSVTSEAVQGKPRPHRGRNLFLGLASLAMLYGGYRWAVTPQVNPNPTRKVVVRGVFPYDRGWELRIEKDFYAKNPLCKVADRAFLIFPAAEVSREHHIWIPVTREEGNQYSFTYFEDHFLPGLCKWRENFTSFNIFQGDQHIQGGAILGLNRQYNRITYDCHFIVIPTPGLGKGTTEKKMTCYEGDNHSRDPRYTDNEVNFIWNEENK